MTRLLLVVVLLLGGVQALCGLRTPLVAPKIVNIAENHGIIVNTKKNISSRRWYLMSAIPTILVGFSPQYALGSYNTIHHSRSQSITHSLMVSFSIANGGDEAVSLLSGYKTAVSDLLVWIVLVGGLYYLYFKIYKILASF